MRIVLHHTRTEWNHIYYVSKNSLNSNGDFTSDPLSLTRCSGVPMIATYMVFHDETHSFDFSLILFKAFTVVINFDNQFTYLFFYYVFFLVASCQFDILICRSRIRFLHLRCWWYQQDWCLWSWRCFASTQHQPNFGLYRKIGRHKETWWKIVVTWRILANLRWSEKEQRTRLLRRFHWMSQIVRQKWERFDVARWIEPRFARFG